MQCFKYNFEVFPSAEYTKSDETTTFTTVSTFTVNRRVPPVNKPKQCTKPD